jgi:HSP20 family molecular chaperone IbpA
MFVQENYSTPPKSLEAPHRNDYMNRMKNRKDFYFNKDGFQAEMDLHDFQADEVSVKTVGSHIEVEAQHSERSDSFSIIQRSFKRKFYLPEIYDPSTVKSSFSAFGILSLSASTHQPSAARIVPVQQLEQMKL